MCICVLHLHVFTAVWWVWVRTDALLTRVVWIVCIASSSHTLTSEQHFGHSTIGTS